MRVTPGFVAVKEDGTFLCMGLQNKWGNESAWWSETNDIEQATVFPFATSRSLLGRLVAQDCPSHTFVPVEVRREVVLKGFGV